MIGTDAVIEILLVEDSEADARLCRINLESSLEMPFILTHVTTLSEAIESVSKETPPTLVLLDLTLPDSAGLDTLKQLMQAAGPVPISVFSGSDDFDLAAQAVAMGATDVLVKGRTDSYALARAVRLSIERTERKNVESQLQKHDNELKLAQDLQQRLYPSCAPRVAGFDMAGAAWPAERVGGDYYDFLPMPDDSWAVVLGDVSGHGLLAALGMIETRAFLQALCPRHVVIAEVMQPLNRYLCDSFATGTFLTMFFARFIPEQNMLFSICAGHPGWIIKADGTIVDLQIQAMPLGFLKDWELEPTEVFSFHKGDILFVPTDGFYEARRKDDSFFGIKRMLEEVRDSRLDTAENILKKLHASVKEFSGSDVVQADDQAAIIIKRK
jgi:sigma-B regulation protein RsbU (phosphoserine phosphatase)